MYFYFWVTVLFGLTFPGLTFQRLPLMWLSRVLLVKVAFFLLHSMNLIFLSVLTHKAATVHAMLKFSDSKFYHKITNLINERTKWIKFDSSNGLNHSDKHELCGKWKFFIIDYWLQTRFCNNLRPIGYPLYSVCELLKSHLNKPL